MVTDTEKEEEEDEVMENAAVSDEVDCDLTLLADRLKALYRDGRATRFKNKVKPVHCSYLAWQHE